jgi:hypothetical protein
MNRKQLLALTALLLAPLAAFAQEKPEVANATQAAKRAWESAPAETKALWQQQREALKHIDLSDDTQRQIEKGVRTIRVLSVVAERSGAMTDKTSLN